MAERTGELEQVVGVRFERRGAVAWFRAGTVPATPGSWVVAWHGDREALGQVVVGRGQCLEFPDQVDRLPALLRPARPEERPPAVETDGRRLLNALPLADR